MIQVIKGTQKKIPYNDILLTIGNFDGVHRGHKKILDCMSAEKDMYRGASAVYTFDPHPRAFFKKKIEKLITPLDEKINMLEKAGVDIIVVEKFTETIANMNTQTFFKNIIIEKIHPKKIFTGTHFRFGKNREGSVEDLKCLALESHIAYERIEPLYHKDGQRVSSSLIRSFLNSGQIREAAEYLGRPYSVGGVVIKGRRTGRTIDIPTANMDFGSFIAPKDGVYAVKIEYDCKEYNGAANIMIRDTEPLLEVHLFDFNEILYGKKMKVYFIERLRDEMLFKNSIELKKQITKDILNAKKIFQINH